MDGSGGTARTVGPSEPQVLMGTSELSPMRYPLGGGGCEPERICWAEMSDSEPLRVLTALCLPLPSPTAPVSPHRALCHHSTQPSSNIRSILIYSLFGP